MKRMDLSYLMELYVCIVSDQKKTKLSGSRRRPNEGLISWMLSCRDKVTVLEPEWIRETLYQITSEIAKRYEGERE